MPSLTEGHLVVGQRQLAAGGIRDAGPEQPDQRADDEQEQARRHRGGEPPFRAEPSADPGSGMAEEAVGHLSCQRARATSP